MVRSVGAVFLVLFTAFLIVPALALPALSIPDAVLTVKENENRQMALTPSRINCNDSDGNATRVSWKSTSPLTLCGDCFPVWPDSGGIGYNVMFIPKFGRLNYDVQPSYLVTLACTDDNGEEVYGTVEVRVEPNTPPYFTKPNFGYLGLTSSNTVTKKFGDEIFNVDANDIDGDPVYYTMTADPSTGLFDIGYANGQITAKKDLRLLCDPSVKFYVTATDNINSPVGPVVIDATFSKSNQRPQVPADVTVSVKENVVVGNSVYDVAITDDGVGPDLQYTVKATPERGLEYYMLEVKAGKARIKVRDTLDYEYLDLRTVTLSIEANDGFCTSPPQKVTIEITDVNEKPTIKPAYREITVYEGFLNLDPEWNLVDPDENENHRWGLLSGGANKFDVDEDTGHIFSIQELDIDPDKVSQTFNMAIRVLDKENVRATADVKIIVLDKNDNVPYFTSKQYEFSASPCSKVGKILGTVFARDDDSEFQGNDELVFSGTSNNMTVMSDGTVILTKPCEPVGASDFLSAHVTDQGQYPGPLSGVPVPVSLTCGPCPSPSPSPTAAGNTASNTSSGATADDNTTNFFDANLGWLVPAILLGVLLAGLLAYLIWRCCTRACARCRESRAVRQNRSNKPEPTKSKPVKEKKQPQKERPSPPTPPPPDKDPFFFGFWKETYPDRDQRHMPNRGVIPASVAADRMVQEKETAEELEEKKKREAERQKEMEKYQKELEQYHKKMNELNNPQQLPPKKRCIIL